MELKNYLDIKVDLPDGHRANVAAIVPVTDSDTIEIEPPVDGTDGASVIGFIEDTTGGVIAINNFYVGTVNTVRINNQKGNNVTIVSLNAGIGVNYISRGN